MNDIQCPFCKNPLGVQTPLPAIITCARCSRTWNVYQLFWVQKGVKIDLKKQIRCPFCNVLLAEGDYSDREQTFKCRNCKNFCHFQRIDGFPMKEGNDEVEYSTINQSTISKRTADQETREENGNA